MTNDPVTQDTGDSAFAGLDEWIPPTMRKEGDEHHERRRAHELTGLVLDETDPFESAISDMVRMNRKKRADYALDGDMFSNFAQSAAGLGIPGFGIPESIQHLINVKIARLNALRANGRMFATQNEGVKDTYLDLAVYSAILWSWVKENM